MKKFRQLVHFATFVLVLLSTTIVPVEPSEDADDTLTNEGECVEGECANPDAVEGGGGGAVEEAVEPTTVDNGPSVSESDESASSDEIPVPQQQAEEMDASTTPTASDAASDSAAAADASKTAKKAETCPDREHLMRCASVYLDSNKNGKLDRSELQVAINNLPWYARGILNVLGSLDKMMKKCDVDKDDAISIDYDMEHNKDSCLATCFKRRAFKAAFFSECDL